MYPYPPFRIRNMRHKPMFMRVKRTFPIRNTSGLLRMKKAKNRQCLCGVWRMLRIKVGVGGHKRKRSIWRG